MSETVPVRSSVPHDIDTAMKRALASLLLAFFLALASFGGVEAKHATAHCEPGFQCFVPMDFKGKP